MILSAQMPLFEDKLQCVTANLNSLTYRDDAAMLFWYSCSLPYLRDGQVVTSAQRWGRISSAKCATPM